MAVLLESLPPSFSWDYCLCGNERLTAWMLCAIGLANRLLGARLNCAAMSSKAAARLPRWLPDAVLTAWGSAPVTELPLPRAYLERRLGLGELLRSRWQRSPVEILYESRSPLFFSLPGPAIQVMAFLLRALCFASRWLNSRMIGEALPQRSFDVHA